VLPAEAWPGPRQAEMWPGPHRAETGPSPHRAEVWLGSRRASSGGGQATLFMAHKTVKLLPVAPVPG
jgi:hypothetical protein